jgi:hypothetical protein
MLQKKTNNNKQRILIKRKLISKNSEHIDIIVVSIKYGIKKELLKIVMKLGLKKKKIYILLFNEIKLFKIKIFSNIAI